MVKDKAVDFKAMAAKWQKKWAEAGIFKAVDGSKKKKYYVLEMYPYPSASYLHMGHVRNYTMGDVYARFKRMQGFNVLYPMGYDSFGLPAETAAKKEGIHPKKYTEDAVKKITEYFKALGNSYDWSRTLSSHDPDYFKWNQYFFIKLFEKGLAYRKKAPVNWCDNCQSVLANEEAEGGSCWRCESEVHKKDLAQWFYRITAYSDRLLEDLKRIDWPERIKTMQENWIGKSYGTDIIFTIDDEPWNIFTTRPDTIYGVTFMVISAQHPRLLELISPNCSNEVKSFIAKCKKVRTPEEIESLEKEGVFIGKYAINPLTNEKVPVYAGNFVLADYGCGMVMAVPAHDQRDFEFAKKYNIPIKVVINPPMFDLNAEKMARAYTGEGRLVNSGEFSGSDSKDAIEEITSYLEKIGKGKKTLQYKIRDWMISRQRYWGTPIPIIYCEHCAKKKQKVIIIHGFEGEANSNWFPWLKKELEKQGLDVILEDMPDSSHPKLEKWIEKLLKLTKDFDENDIIIGHSLGGKAALHLAEKLKHVNSVYLVAPVPPLSFTNEHWNKLRKEWNGSDINSLKEFSEAKLDLGKVEHHTKRRILILSDDDPYIPLNTQKMFDKKKWEIIILSKKGHIQEPPFNELLNELLKDKKELGIIPVPYKDLPVMLPEKVDFNAKENPLLSSKEFLHVKCPVCGGIAHRETDTMGGFVDSSWYFLRYCDNKNKKKAFDSEKVDYWMPVDQYIGGAEHAVMHLIYARFFVKALKDLGFVKFDEPFSKLFNQGILYKDGAKMSKSKGNIVTQDQLEKTYGIDAARFFLMFLASPDKAMEWDDKTVEGTYRFLLKVYRMLTEKKIVDKVIKNQESRMHKTILEVSENIQSFKYNLALISIMKFANYLFTKEEINRKAAETLLVLISPFTPHIAEELWDKLGNKPFISLEKWPVADKKKIDEKAEAAEELYDAVRRDILALQELTGLTKPNKIMLIIPNIWKYAFISELKKEMEKTREVGALIKSFCSKDKVNAKLIANLVPRFVKNPDKMPLIVLSQETEKKALSACLSELEKEFKTRFEVVLEKDSKHEKAQQAMPSKPAIVFE